MPETSEKFMLVNDRVSARSESKAQPEIDFMQWQQRVYGLVKSWLERGRARENDWQVIFSNLSKARVEKALDSSRLVGKDGKDASSDQSYATSIRDFWREAFDILIIAPSVGYTIIRLEREESAEVLYGLSTLDQIDMLVEIGDIDIEEIALKTFRMNYLSLEEERRELKRLSMTSARLLKR